MLKKIYKEIIIDDLHKITIYGSDRWIRLDYRLEEIDLLYYFTYRRRRYYLSDFLAVHNPIHNPSPLDWMTEFEGYQELSYGNGLLIKVAKNLEAVKAFTYIC